MLSQRDKNKVGRRDSFEREFSQTGATHTLMLSYVISQNYFGCKLWKPNLIRLQGICCITKLKIPEVDEPPSKAQFRISNTVIRTQFCSFHFSFLIHSWVHTKSLSPKQVARWHKQFHLLSYSRRGSSFFLIKSQNWGSQKFIWIRSCTFFWSIFWAWVRQPDLVIFLLRRRGKISSNKTSEMTLGN